MRTTEEILKSIKRDLASLLTEIPPSLSTEISLKLASIWQDVRTLLYCRKDELETIQALCDDIINMMLKGTCQKPAIISCAEAILELTYTLGPIQPYITQATLNAKPPKPPQPLKLTSELAKTSSKPPKIPSSTSDQTLILNFPKPPEPPK